MWPTSLMFLASLWLSSMSHLKTDSLYETLFAHPAQRPTINKAILKNKPVGRIFGRTRENRFSTEACSTWFLLSSPHRNLENGFVVFLSCTPAHPAKKSYTTMYIVGKTQTNGAEMY